MPNGGLHHCANCRHFSMGKDICNLRNEKIYSPFWTTCDSIREKHPVPKGVMKAMVGEVKDSVCRYTDIPYYLGSRPDTIQKQSAGNTVVSVNDEHGNILEFSSVEEYNEFYSRIYDLPLVLIGPIAGDVIGSVYEFHNIKSTDFPLFKAESIYTDDTIMTLAVAAKLIRGSAYEEEMQYFGRRYPGTSYGINFRGWLFSKNPQPYNSFGNGSAMRVSPVAYAFDDLEDVLREALKSAEVTHNHPEGIKGAQAVAAAVFLARNGTSKEEIRRYITDNFGYDLSRSTDKIRPVYGFDETCQGSVPEAIICFLESRDFEDAIRLAVSIGGDSDTIACITGAVAEAFYKGVPESIRKEAIKLLPDDLLKVLIDFSRRFVKEF